MTNEGRNRNQRALKAIPGTSYGVLACRRTGSSLQLTRQI